MNNLPLPVIHRKFERHLAMEPLEERIVLSAAPVGNLDIYRVDLITVPGPDDTTAIAVNVNEGMLATTDSYQDVLEISSIQTPNDVLATISFDDLKNATGYPTGSVSGGSDGMTSVFAWDDGFLVLAITTSTTSTTQDLIAKISADGSSIEPFAIREISNDGGSFNRSEITATPAGDRFFLASDVDLVELDSSGNLVQSIATGNFNGVAIWDGALFAIDTSGQLYGDTDITDGVTLSLVCNTGEYPYDLEMGAFGSLGSRLFMLESDGDVAYWSWDDLTGGATPAPTPLFHVGDGMKLDLADGEMWVAKREDAMRISQVSIPQLEVEQSVVQVVEGAGSQSAIRMRLTAPPIEPMVVNLVISGGDPDIRLETTEVTFDQQNWRADQYIVLEAIPDTDATDGEAQIVALGPQLDPLSITVQELDKDGLLEMTVLSTEVTVREGHTGSSQIVLTADPGESISVTTSRLDGDVDLSVEAHETITFDSTNWFRPQWVSFQAAEDVDMTNGVAHFAISSPGLTTQQIEVTEADQGEPGTLKHQYEVLIDDYGTIPLQGETNDIDFYNRIRGDHGATTYGGGVVEFDRGTVLAKATTDVGFAGMWHSLNHVVGEDRRLNLNALLPPQIAPEYQYAATGIVIEVEEGSGELNVELKRDNGPTSQVWASSAQLTGGSQRIEFDLPSSLGEVQLLNWLVDDLSNEVRISRVALLVEGPDLGYMETFVWPYATILENFDWDSGVTRDRHAFPVGDYDAVNATGAQAALAALAEQFGVISTADAEQIVAKSRDFLLDLLERDSIGGIMPHFVHYDSATDGYQIVEDTEYSTIDTLIGWAGVLLGSTALGLPTDAIETAIRDIDWESLIVDNGSISHGYEDTGELISSGWDYFGTESLLVAMFHGAATGTLPAIPNVDPVSPETFNGSGFIDELLWMFVDPIGIDAWGVNWNAYRQQAVQNQLDHYDTYPVPAFGASAVEPPIPSQVEVLPDKDYANPYAAYGVGGTTGTDDGSSMYNQAVVAPHYSQMVSTLVPDASRRMWDWLVDSNLATPLNHVESLVVQQWGEQLETHFHGLKGSWNLALDALGAASGLLGDQNVLWQASLDNAFLQTGMELIESSGSCLDVDHNGEADALSDGIIIIRYLFGFRDDQLVNNALGPDATRTDPAEIADFLDTFRTTMLDVDDNGKADALTDGILILRYLFGFRDDELVKDALGSNPPAQRTNPGEIATFIDGYLLPCPTEPAAQALPSPSPSASTDAILQPNLHDAALVELTNTDLSTASDSQPTISDDFHSALAYEAVRSQQLPTSRLDPDQLSIAELLATLEPL